MYFNKIKYIFILFLSLKSSIVSIKYFRLKFFSFKAIFILWNIFPFIISIISKFIWVNIFKALSYLSLESKFRIDLIISK